MSVPAEHAVSNYYAVVRSGTGTLGKPTVKIELKDGPQNPAIFDQVVVMLNSTNQVHLYIKGIKLIRQELQGIAHNIDPNGGQYRQRA
jgi:hypothetical protein